MSKTVNVTARIKSGDTITYSEDVTDCYNEYAKQATESWHMVEFEEEKINAVAERSGFAEREDFLCWTVLELV